MHWMICNMTYLGHDMPSHDLDLRLNFDLNLWRSTSWATEGMGEHMPPVQNYQGHPQKFWYLKKIFRIFTQIFRFYNISIIKWVKSLRRKQNLGVGGFHSPESIPPVRIHPYPTWNFVVTGDALGRHVYIYTCLTKRNMMVPELYHTLFS